MSDPTTATGVVRYWASAREAAGVPEESVPAASLADALAYVRSAHPDPRFATVLAISSIVVDGRPLGTRDPATVVLAPGWVAEVLPPFAGG